MKEKEEENSENTKDIKDNKAACYNGHKNLSPREQELQKILDCSMDMICMIDSDGTFLNVSAASKDILGYRPEEMTGQPFTDFILEQDIPSTLEAIEKVKAGENNSFMENHYVHKDGTPVPILWSVRWDETDRKLFCVARDATKIKESELRVRKSETLMAEAQKLSKVGSWELDLAENKIYWSKTTREIHEVPSKFELELDACIKFYKKGEHRQAITDAIEQARDNGSPFDLELKIITHSGKEKWIRATGNVEFKDNEPARIFGSFQDIHENKITEIRLKRMTESLPGVSFQYHLLPDGSDRLCHVSKKSVYIWGTPPEECEKDTEPIWALIEAGGDMEILKNSIEESARTMNNWTAQWRSVLPNGSVRWHEGFGTPYLQEDGIYVWDSLIVDITEKKELESLLNRATLMARMGSWEVNLIAPDNDAIFWSPMTRIILEADSDQQPSINGGIEKQHQPWRNQLKETIENLIATGKDFDVEKLITTYKGNPKWVRVIGQAQIVNGKTVKIYGSIQDITDRKEYEVSLEKLNRELEKHSKELELLNSELEQFAFVASHDLQEPLRMVTGFLDLLQRKYGHLFDEKAKSYIGYATDGAVRMRRIITDLLEFSRVGKTAYQKQEVDLDHILEEYLSLRKTLIKAGNAKITFKDLPVIYTFEPLIVQVLHNLLDNALKYSKPEVPTRIEVSVESKKDSWEFSVADNGIGIKKEFYEKIFIIFQRLESGGEKKGTGIGLAIVQKAVESLGGEVWLESEVGEGTTFYFSVSK